MIREKILELKQASRQLAVSPAVLRDELLIKLADALTAHEATIIAANARDLSENEGTLAPALFERLKLTSSKMKSVVHGIRSLAAMPDPLGAIALRTQLDEGLLLERIGVPLGVVAVFFESRPDVLPQVVALALRTGNGLILKGGVEATHTNRAMIKVIQELFERDGRASPKWVLLLEGREAAQEILHYDDLIDLVIPRGSSSFVRYIQNNSSIPVLGHAAGVCHLYLHCSADIDQAIQVVIDAKTQYPSACNAVETILVDQACAAKAIPRLAAALRSAQVRIRCCAQSAALLPDAEVVSDSEWSTEYGDLTVAVRIVTTIDEAIEHINRYGSHHTDGILANDRNAEDQFLREVDSGSVLTNCSTRFADGFRYGFGAEVGISTGRIHARGPVGLEGLLTYKYLLRGNGHLVGSYVGPQARPFQHQKLGVRPVER